MIIKLRTGKTKYRQLTDDEEKQIRDAVFALRYGICNEINNSN
jgi:hypothetical protein